MPTTTAKGYVYPVGGDTVSTYPAAALTTATLLDARPGVSVVSTTARNAYTGSDIWDGRIVWNTTTTQLERYSSATTSWIPCGGSGAGLSLSLSGATSAGRWVGTTPDVAPTSGTFLVGDWINTDTGRMYVCVAGGTPGTWWNVGDDPGSIKEFAGSIPVGWHINDGSAISRSTYAALFANIGTTYGIGDGSTTFNVPDDRGRVTVASGTGSGLTGRTLAAKAGEETHLLLSTESGIPASSTGTDLTPHDHYEAENGYFLSTSGGTGYTGAAAGVGGNWAVSNTGNPRQLHQHGLTATNAVNGHNNMQPYIVYNRAIKL